MPSGEDYDDPEAASRRGFEQGAHMAVEAMAPGVADQSLLSKMREWTGVTLHKWRYLVHPESRDLKPPLPPSN